MNRYFIALSLFLFSTSALAHGQDVLFLFGAEILWFIVVVLISVGIKSLKGKRLIVILSYLAAVIVSWLVTVDVPYLPNKWLLSFSHIIAPTILWLLVMTFFINKDRKEQQLST